MPVKMQITALLFCHYSPMLPTNMKKQSPKHRKFPESRRSVPHQVLVISPVVIDASLTIHQCVHLESRSLSLFFRVVSVNKSNFYYKTLFAAETLSRLPHSLGEILPSVFLFN